MEDSEAEREEYAYRDASYTKPSRAPTLSSKETAEG